MALRDTWHRALVYFGLAEERDEYVDSPIDNELEPEAEIENPYKYTEGTAKVKAQQ